MGRDAGKPNPLKLAAMALRSGLRRYPGELVRALSRPGPLLPGNVLTPTLPAESELAASWLGHASVLFNIDGATVLTDPVFSHRIGPRLIGRTLGIARQDRLGHVELAPPKVVLISHAHFDHLDKPTLRRLASRESTLVCPPGVRRLIPKGFAEIVEIQPGHVEEVGGVIVRAIRPNHWGARTALDRGRGFCSYLLEKRHVRVLFGGDTAHTHAFDNIHATLAVLGIGAYQPWIHAHANPEQVWSMFSRMRARYLLPIHHSTFPLGDEPREEPVNRLMAAAGSDAQRVLRLAPGEVWAVGEGSPRPVHSPP